MKRQLVRALALGVLALWTAADATEAGLKDGEVLLGERSAFTGPSSGLGIELWRGESAAFSAANDAGGVNGRKVTLMLANDAYDAEKAAPAAVQLLMRDQVFALFGGVGTPTLLKVLPILLRYHDKDGTFQFSCFTGAQPQREPPYDQAVFNVRASYREETRAMVKAFVGMGRKRIGIFVQDDAYGASGRDGVKRALKEQHLQLAADTSYPRGMKFQASTTAQINLLRTASVDAIISVGSYQAGAALIRDARNAGWDVPIHNVSFVGADQMLDLLREQERLSGRPLTRNVLVTQVVPSYNDVQLPLVREYRAAMDKYQPEVPPRIADGSYRPPRKYSFGSLEGYMNARVFLAVLARAGRDLSRKGFYGAAEGMGKFDIGLQVPAEFSPSRHQALNKVWFTYPTPDGWASTEAPASVIH